MKKNKERLQEKAKNREHHQSGEKKKNIMKTTRKNCKNQHKLYDEKN